MSQPDLLLILLASIAGTVAMTSIMYLYSLLVKEETRVIHVFGKMLTGDPAAKNASAPILIAGTIGHYSVGFFFSLCYFLLWNWGIFEISVKDTLILGALSGIAAIIIWNIYFSLYLNPPQLSRFHYSVALFVSHIIFAGVTIYFFHLLRLT